MSFDKIKNLSVDKATDYVGRPFLIPLGILNILALLGFVASIIVWIWISWALAWKIGLTCIIVAIISSSLYKYIRRMIRSSVQHAFDTASKEAKPHLSKFMQKLQDYSEKQKTKWSKDNV